jgi:hypothetical protein
MFAHRSCGAAAMIVVKETSRLRGRFPEEMIQPQDEGTRSALMGRTGIVLIMSAVALAATPGSAFAGDDADDVAVAIQGIAQVGQRLDAVLSGEDAEDWRGAGYEWLRCLDERKKRCQVIETPSASSYTIVDSDLGHRIRVVAVRDDDGDGDDGDSVMSKPTAVVTSAPIVVPAPDPAPPAVIAPIVVPGLVVAPPPVVVTDPVPRPPRMMSPAPTVRISGQLTRRGAMIERLSVRAPRGVTISVRCRGDGCPRRTLARSAAVTRLRSFERHLRAGIRLEIRVTRAGFIGKHTVIGIRRGKAPWRRDRCLYPGSVRPARCPGR